MNPTNKVAVWSDVIQSNSMFNANSSTQPTNSPTGVRFDNNLTLSMTNVVISTNDALMFIIQKDNVAQAYEIISGATHEFAINSIHNWITDFANLSGSHAISTAVVQDLIASADATKKTYTNGTLAGASQYWTEQTATMTNCGWNNLWNANERLYILEIAVWTNQALTAGYVASLHTYRTNLYGGSP